MDLTVAIDVSPLQGDRSGVGRFVDGLLRALPALDTEAGAPKVIPYVLSHRATGLSAGTVRLPWPAELAVRTWEHLDRPTCRRQLGTADVVHGTNYIAPPTGLPTVLTVHDCSPLSHPQWCTPVVRRFAAVVRRAAAHGAWIHAPSQHVADQAAALLGTDRVVVIPHGPPDPTGTMSAGLGAAGHVVADTISGRTIRPDVMLDGAPYVVAIGTLEQRKNLARLVTAFAALGASHPDLHLVLVGGAGNDRVGIESAVNELPPAMQRRVHLTGRVAEAQRVAWLRGALMLAYPSLEEGFGFPLLEAMAAGIPIVGSTAGAIVETADGAAVLVDARDVDALAGGMARVASDDALRARLIADGQRRVGDFSWERTATEMIALYRRAVQEHS
jgi:glycosyltransferase involved in cell wall biosynthesis